MVEHQPHLLGSRVRFPAGAFAIFFRFCQSFTSNFPFPFPFLFLSLPLPFPSSSFPFLFLSLRPFVCALKSHSSHLFLRRATGEPLGSDPANLPDHNVHFFTSHEHLLFVSIFFSSQKAQHEQKIPELSEIDPRGRYDNSGTQARGRYGKKL